MNAKDFYRTILPHRRAERFMKKSKKILDLGCGNGSFTDKFMEGREITGVDCFATKPKYKEFYNVDLRHFLSEHDLSEFDTITLLGVIEHLPRAEGEHILKLLDRFDGKIIIETPSGFKAQREYQGNPYQLHKSGWFAHDFEKYGFKVYGKDGLKYLTGEFGVPYPPKALNSILGDITEMFLWNVPSLSLSLLAVREARKK
jgi:predicted TPR repeat methyltransferase